LSITDPALGDPGRLLQALNATPLLSHPWPNQQHDEYAKEKSTILLALGYLPLFLAPPYAAESEMMTATVRLLQFNHILTLFRLWKLRVCSRKLARRRQAAKWLRFTIGWN
jgi:hypothetical protein